MGNHIQIVLDDIGFAGIAVFAPLIGVYDAPKTPIMDAVAAAGVQFTQCRFMPVCSPTRVAMLTGQYPHRSGIFDNVNTTDLIPDATAPWAPNDFSSHELGLFGKMHFGNIANGQVLAPLKSGSGGVAGFDIYKGPFENIVKNTLLGDPQTYFNWTKVDTTLASPYLVDVGVPGETFGSETAANYATTVTIDDAIDWIENTAVGDWVISVNLNAAHVPIHVPPAALLSAESQTRRQIFVDSAAEAVETGEQAVWIYARRLREAGIPNNVDSTEKLNWEAVKLTLEAADTEIGRLLASSAVDLGVDTTVWILGDNGPPSQFTVSPENPEKTKRSQYESGIRCPLIVRGAAVSDTGVCDGLVNAVDIWETIAAVEGVTRTGTRDGNDFSAALADVDAATGRTYSLSEQFGADPPGVVDFGIGPNSLYTQDENDTGAMVRSLTDGTYKLIRWYDMTQGVVARSEFYKIADDPLENDNLLSSPFETFDSCRRGCQDYPALRRLQREFVLLSPGL